MNDKEVLQLYEEMVKYFDGRVPNLEHYPRQFAYYVGLYKYKKRINEGN